MKLPFIEAGEIVTTHGVRGEMKILTWLDSPEDLCDFERCRIDGREYRIEACRVQKTCNLLKVAGIDTMEAAQAMRGKIVELYREDIADDVIFAAELIGMEVYAQDTLLGKIEDVLDYPGNQVYVVRGTHEYLIPAVKAFVHSTDLEANRMQVTVIEGMRSDEN
ncbi:MAG: ribosome maturation factor RimM [Faecousia sp.]